MGFRMNPHLVERASLPRASASPASLFTATWPSARPPAIQRDRTPLQNLNVTQSTIYVQQNLHKATNDRNIYPDPNLTILLAMDDLKNIVNTSFQIPNESFDDRTQGAKSGSVLEVAIRATDMLKCINLPNIQIELDKFQWVSFVFLAMGCIQSN